MGSAITTIILLVISNVFMTFAWYGHLKFKAAPLVIVSDSAESDAGGCGPCCFCDFQSGRF